MTLIKAKTSRCPDILFPKGWKEFIWRKKNNMDEMSLDDFLAHWDVSRPDLAAICECSVGTVNHWFMKGPSRRELEPHHRRRLADAHRELIRMQLQESLEASRYRDLYKSIRVKKS